MPFDLLCGRFLKRDPLGLGLSVASHVLLAGQRPAEVSLWREARDSLARPEAASKRAWARFGSAARDRVDVLDRARQRQRRPGLSAIMGAKHLALIARADIDLVGVVWMQRHRHDRSVNLHLVKPAPRLPRVLTPIEPAVVARGCDTERRVNGFRVLGRHPYIAP